MGHMAGKDIYKKVVKKIDSQTVRVPLNERIHTVVKSLFGEDEAHVYVAMPYTLSTAERVARAAGMSVDRVRPILERMCNKGLVMDMHGNGEYHYMPSPLAVGIFEFTMMRMGEIPEMEDWGRMFHEYFHDGSLYHANFTSGEQISVLRALPHEESLADFVEVLDFEKASAIVDSFDTFAISTCSCRHEKFHANAKECDSPMDTCTTFGQAADFVIRRNMGRAVEKAEILDILARSKDLGLVLQADNVQRNVTAICHCCGCCCNVLQGFNKFGLENAIVTSGYIARVDLDSCTGCGKCAKKCPIQVISMEPDTSDAKRKKRPVVDTNLCIGCGVCGLTCKPGAIRLVPREKRVITPETAFERVVLQSLERGTLQNQIFDDPTRLSHRTGQALLGAFLRLSPVKKALMSDTLRSRFLGGMKLGLKAQGKGWMAEM